MKEWQSQYTMACHYVQQNSVCISYIFLDLTTKTILDAPVVQPSPFSCYSLFCRYKYFPLCSVTHPQYTCIFFHWQETSFYVFRFSECWQRKGYLSAWSHTFPTINPFIISQWISLLTMHAADSSPPSKCHGLGRVQLYLYPPLGHNRACNRVTLLLLTAFTTTWIQSLSKNLWSQ
jgi:hypothetical protein